MYTVHIVETTPGGQNFASSSDYYEVSDAIAVAVIERNNILYQTGWMEDFVNYHHSWKQEYRLNCDYSTVASISIYVTKDREGPITLPPSESDPFVAENRE